jgi:steroid 5-alpha reductase family enzyme
MSGMMISLYALAGALTVLFGLWLLSLRLRDVSIVDIFWGPGFVLIAWITWALSSADSTRALLALACTTAWGLRLGLYLGARNLGHGEDKRYAAMRRRDPEGFPPRSLFTVFGLQGLLMWIVSLPVQTTIIAPGSAPIGPLDWVAGALFLLGLGFEAIGDAQLTRFKSDPANAGRVMDRGLWAWTRHPNYFGDATAWWGLGLLAVSAGHPWALIGPLVMNVLLLRVSGVPLLERGMRKTRPDYEAYARRTSSFIPWPPRREPS